MSTPAADGANGGEQSHSSSGLRDQSSGSLLSYEVWWCDRYLWLEQHGYQLRPRYHPDWVGSWATKGGLWPEYEDGWPSAVSVLHTRADSLLILL